MSDQEDPRTGPPPGDVFELAERAVDFVRRALGMTLDYTAETLPVLDHYLGTVPTDQAATVDLIAATAGAYFGEVIRKELGATWELDGAPAKWQLVLSVGVRFAPVGAAVEAITHDDAEGEGAWEVPDGERQAVEEALEGREVSVEEYFSLSGRFETLQLVADVIAGRKAARS
jgi:hypothetical protein